MTSRPYPWFTRIPQNANGASAIVCDKTGEPIAFFTDWQEAEKVAGLANRFSQYSLEQVDKLFLGPGN